LVKLDHVVFAVEDLELAARLFEARYGLASVDGGRHGGWGTANRIVPLGDAYLELIGVMDEEAATESPFGSWMLQTRSQNGRPVTWAIRTTDIDLAASRLGLTVVPGSRDTAEGQALSWRMAGVDRAMLQPGLPFFIEWGPETPFPGDGPVQHRAGRVRISRLDLSIDSKVISSWLGPHDLPISVRPGSGGIERVVLASDGAEIVLSSETA
jgi:hypothetical protein